jgi:hypothetical protein
MLKSAKVVKTDRHIKVKEKLKINWIDSEEVTGPLTINLKINSPSCKDLLIPRKVKSI